MAASATVAGHAGETIASAGFERAHGALLADPSIQFTLAAPAPPPEAPAWLKAIGDAIAWVLSPIGRVLAWIGGFFPQAPYARMLLWTALAALAAAVMWMAVERVRYGEWRVPRIRRRVGVAADADAGEQSLFDAAPVRAWLREADALAAVGRFAEAAHLLLFRSVEELARRRPSTVKPALTARELAAAPAIPTTARARFASIAALVERSLFGGRPVDAADWSTARAEYVELALPGSWRA